MILSFLRRCPIIALAIISSAAAAQAQTVIEGPGFPYDISRGEVVSTAVSERIHMFTIVGGNIGVHTGKDGVFLVDDRFDPVSDEILAALRDVTDRPIRFLVNTHFHGDHTGANADFARAGAIITAHDNVRRTLSQPHFIEALRTGFAAYTSEALPLVTFSKDMTFHLQDEEIYVFHVPNAHTDGDSIIYFRDSDVIATGDVYQRKGYPVVDRHNGGTFSGLIAVWRRIYSEIGPDTVILPGHGALSDKAELGAAIANVSALYTRITDALKAGHSLEQVMAENLTAGIDQDWPDKPLTGEMIVEWMYHEHRH